MVLCQQSSQHEVLDFNHGLARSYIHTVRDQIFPRLSTITASHDFTHDTRERAEALYNPLKKIFSFIPTITFPSSLVHHIYASSTDRPQVQQSVKYLRRATLGTNIRVWAWAKKWAVNRYHLGCGRRYVASRRLVPRSARGCFARWKDQITAAGRCSPSMI